MLDEERLGLKVVQTWQKEINRMGNLEPRRTGPYKVTECLTKGLYNWKTSHLENF